MRDREELSSTSKRGGALEGTDHCTVEQKLERAGEKGRAEPEEVGLKM